MKYLYFSLLFVIYVFCTVEAERTKKKIYVNISGRNACFRRFNATHQIGCTSDPKGNVGVVHYIDTHEDLTWLLNIGSDKPYAVLLRPDDFNGTTLSLLRASGKVNGIMIIHVKNQTYGNTPQSFSPDTSCPNDQHGLYAGEPDYEGCKKSEWNPEGSGMMFEDIGFPIFVMTNETEVDFIIDKCYKRFNQRDNNSIAPGYPLCAVQLKDRMDGAKDSETCIRRTRHQINLSPMRYCDPMGDQNVYATLKAINNTQERKEKSVIVVAARMDSFSMFEDFYPSADNHISGIIALLAAAEAIGKVKDTIINKADSKDIMFTFFQGEAFDYIGSERMVYDMEKNEFPAQTGGAYLQKMALTHISEVIEVNQLSYRDQGRLWIHTDPISRKNISSISVKIKEMIGKLENISQSVGSVMEEVGPSQPLPPASVQSFLKKKAIPAVVITDHKQGYTNKYYNSRFDLASAIGASYPDSMNQTDWYDYVTDQAEELAQVSTVLAQYLYGQATLDDAPDSLVVDNKTVTHLLYCFLYSPNCELFKQVMSADKAKTLDNKPYPFYVSVQQTSNNVTSLVWRMLLRYLGDKVNLTKSSCEAPDNNQIYQYQWMQGPEINGTEREPFCMRWMANFSTAVSKAFELDDYDWGSGQFSTWTESAWGNDAMDVRLFLIPSKKFETTTLSVGVVILLVAMMVVFWMNRKTDTLFNHPPYRI